MYNNTADRTASRRRQTALVLAIFLHLALAAGLYYASMENSVNKQLTSPENLHKNNSPQPSNVAQLP
jgi:hypothetical protein